MVANQSRMGQMSIFNCFAGLSPRTVSWLVSSWAFTFRLFVFPLIDPSLFDCLYSEVDSRPANPPQVVVSLLVIQAMFNLTDDQMHDWFMSGALDLRLATDTMGLSAELLPTYDKQLTNFRNRNRAYAKTHDGHYPLEECMQSVSFAMAAMMGIDMRNVRIDSTMVSANIMRMSRQELLYTVNSQMVHVLFEGRGEEFMETLKKSKVSHYLDAGDHNTVIYYSGLNADEKCARLAEESQVILGLCSEAELDSDKGKIFTRVLSEQTVLENGKRRMATSEDGTMTSKCVQNPADEWATYRKKAGKEFIGYIISLAEAVGPMGSLVLSWDFRQNVVSDPVMAQTFLGEAKSIIDGIKQFDQELGIPEDADMARCQALLQEKLRLVSAVIRDASAHGRTLPTLCSEEDLSGNSREESSSIDYSQVSLDDLLNNPDLLKQAASLINASAGSASTAKNPVIPEREKAEPAPADAAPLNQAAPSLDGDESSPQPKAMPDTPVDEHVPGSETLSEHADPTPGTETKETEEPPVQSFSFTNASGQTVQAWTVFGLPGMQGIMLPKFAELMESQRREALLLAVREKHSLNVTLGGDERLLVGDGAYSPEDLIHSASQVGFRLLPTDLLGKSVNPIVGLFAFSEEKDRVVECPAGFTPLSQTLNANGSIRIKIDSEHCSNCPFRNDCKCTFQKRTPTSVVTVSPNAQGRIFTEALMGTEQYKSIGRFRNGVETIPGFLHNHLDIDHLPIGKAVKKFYMDVKIGALNVWKFIRFAARRTRYAANPVYNR